MNPKEKAHYEKLTTIGCIACRVLGYGYTPCEIHHIRFGQGVGKRAEFDKAIPLCPHHHRLGSYGTAYHAGRRAFERTVGKTEIELLELTNQLLKEL